MARTLLLLLFFCVSPAFARRAPCVEVFLELGRTVPHFDFFKANFPRFSIGVDGFIEAPTMREPLGPWANYDHHFGVDRISTRSTAEQLYMEINLGFYRTFRRNGMPYVRVYANDYDEDVATTIWLLRNPHLVVRGGHSRVRRLVFYNDKMDVTAGSFPLRSRANKERNWIYKPYHDVRKAQRLGTLSAQEGMVVIDEIGERISEYVAGRGGEEAIDTSYRVLDRGRGWVFVGDTGPDARLGLVAKGVQAYAMNLGNGRFVVGRLSEWVPFPLAEIFKALNAAEPAGLVTETNHWDGSGTIGGSPRFTGSKLSVEEIKRVIDGVVAAHRRRR